MGLTKAAITRPVFMLMLMVAALLLGSIAWNSMNVEQSPNINFGIVTVTTAYPGASPEEIEELITRPIENAAAGVSGIRQIESSSLQSFSQVVIQFELHVDINRAMNDVRSNIDAVVNNLPKDIPNKPVVNKLNVTGAPILYYALSHPTMSGEELRDLANNTLSQFFSQIEGVAAVSVSGGDIREIQVRVSKDKLLAYQVGILDVLNPIMATNQNVPAGYYRSNGQQFNVRVVGQFERIEQLKNMRIARNDPRNPMLEPRIVNLSDIADIEDTTAERTDTSRLNGNDTVILSVLQTTDGNTVNISRNAADVVLRIEKEYGIKLTNTFDQAKLVQSGLEDLNIAIGFGIFLVTVVVFVFLHNLRGTIIVGLAIPTTIFAAFAAMSAFGFTINSMSMLALSLAVGVLVDDAIVVLENIYRHLKLGEDPVSASINGRAEIGLAAIAITICDVVVFLPVGLMGGLVGQFFAPLAFVYVIVVLLSLFVSFTITPMLASRWYRAGEDFEHPKGRFAAWFERKFESLEHSYKNVLDWALNHRWFVFIFGFAILVFIFQMIAASFASTLVDAVKTSFNLVKISIVLAVAVFVINALKGHFKLRFLWYGALYGLFFVSSSVLGYGYAQWKGSPIFKFSFLPNSDSGLINIDIEMAPGDDLSTTQKTVEKIEGIVAKHTDVKNILSSVGFSGGGKFVAANQGPYLAQVTAFLYDKISLMDTLGFTHEAGKMRHESDITIAAQLLKMIGKHSGAFIKVSAGSGIGPGGSPIQMDFVSTTNDRSRVVGVVSEILSKLKPAA